MEVKTWDQQVKAMRDEIVAAVTKGSPIRVERARVLGVKIVEGQDRVVEYVASDESVDRYGDLVRVNGWDLKAWDKAQTFLWGHDYATLPLGMGLKAWKEPAEGKKGPRLMAWLQYAPRDISEFADTVYRMVEARILRSVSVGFSPSKINDPVDDEERKELVWRTLQRNSRPIYHLIDDVFPFVPEGDIFLAISEILVHLELLIDEGRAELADPGPPAYYRAL